jgi:hypothetical protein
MYTYNIRINDAVMQRVKSHFNDDDDMRCWIEKEVERVMVNFAERLSLRQSDDSHDEHIYQQVKALENDPQGLAKIGEILKPSPYSPEELLDEYISEKYGV